MVHGKCQMICKLWTGYLHFDFSLWILVIIGVK